MDQASTRVKYPTARAIGRYAVAGVGLLVMALASGLIWSATSTYSSHFCGWPARLACESSTPMWWLVPIGVWAATLAGAVLLVRWARSGRPQELLGLLHVAWVAGFFPLVLWDSQIRTFEAADLVRFGIYGGLGIQLLRAFGMTIWPTRRRTVNALTFAAWAVFVASLLTLPEILESAEG